MDSSFLFEDIAVEYNSPKLYDYVCHVQEEYFSNDNGSYLISIVDSDSECSFGFNGWELKEARLTYDWGTSISSFILQDKKGNLTDKVKALRRRGSKKLGGVNLDEHVEAVVSKAKEIMNKYPSVEVYNVADRLENFLQESEVVPFATVEDFEKNYKTVGEALGYYHSLLDLLDVLDDKKANQLYSEFKGKVWCFLSMMQPKAKKSI